MTIQPQEKLTSLAEFEAFIALPENRHRLFELIEGEIVEKMPTQLHGYIAGQFITEFNLYLREHPIGYAYVEARYRPVGDTNNDRLPDVSFSTNSAIVAQGPVSGMPDIAVEIQSPDDDPREMLQTAYFYLDHGAKFVLLVLTPKRQVMRIVRGDLTVFNEGETLDFGELLPGFTLAVSKIFPPVQK